jgi:HSP20 family molecular chaperone IbpA
MTLRYSLYRRPTTYDRLFGSVLNQVDGLPAITAPAKCYDVQDNDEHFTIVVPIPGVKKENINVSLDNRSLKINCESELQFGVRKFSNNFTVRPGTTEEHVSASYEDGVLRVQVQKVDPSAGATQIPVA